PSSATQPVVSTFSASRGAAMNDKDSMKLITQIRQLGLDVTPCSIRNVALKIEKLREGLSTGQIKIFRRACAGAINEIKTFMYDEEKRIIKRNDHKVDALGYAMLDSRRIVYYADEEEEDESSYNQNRNNVTGY